MQWESGSCSSSHGDIGAQRDGAHRGHGGDRAAPPPGGDGGARVERRNDTEMYLRTREAMKVSVGGQRRCDCRRRGTSAMEERRCSWGWKDWHGSPRIRPSKSRHPGEIGRRGACLTGVWGDLIGWICAEFRTPAETRYSLRCWEMRDRMPIEVDPMSLKSAEYIAEETEDLAQI
jgi:hypothetical protein